MIPTTEDIINAYVNENGTVHHQVYDRLAKFTDLVGTRLCGSEKYNEASKYMINALKEDGLEDVHIEAVTVPQWVRGDESLTMITPKSYKFNFMGLGTSVGTSPEGITAGIVAVTSFDELASKASEIPGKFVVYNQYCDWDTYPLDCYDFGINYREFGASEAAKYGAVGALIKTVGSNSIDSPHTGMQSYYDGVVQIPAACITIEDAEALFRMYTNGYGVVLNLVMGAQTLEDTINHNVVADWKGYEHPEEVVIVSGHLDSWDLAGVGAMDDGGGFAIGWQTLVTLKSLNIRAKRTLRLVLWACEEFGGIGGEAYYNQHKNESELFDLVFESDMGTFGPTGIGFTGNDDATAIMNEIVTTLLAPLNATTLEIGGSEEDNGYWEGSNVPTATLESDNERYFWYHHSHGDQMSIFNKDELDLAAAVWTITSYAVAELDDMLPRNATTL